MCGWFVGVRYPEFRSFGVFAYGDRVFWCPGMSSNAVTPRLAAVSVRSLPLVFVCPPILCSIVGRPSLILYWSERNVAAISG